MPAFDDCADAFVAWITWRARISKRLYITCEDGVEIASADSRYLGPDKDLVGSGTWGWEIGDYDVTWLYELCSFHARSLAGWQAMTLGNDALLPALPWRASPDRAANAAADGITWPKTLWMDVGLSMRLECSASTPGPRAGCRTASGSGR
jgi:hypothetical protein